MANRILSLRLKNIKCVKNGVVLFPHLNEIDSGDLSSLLSANVLGLYGQNGSGKTTAYDAFHLLKCLALGVPLHQRVSLQAGANNEINYILHVGSKTGEIVFEFLVELGKKDFRVRYSIELKRKSGGVSIARESISVSTPHESRTTWKRLSAPQEINFDSNDLNFLYDGINHRKDCGKTRVTADSLDLYSKLLAEKLNCSTNGLSFIFCERNITYLLGHPSEKVRVFGSAIRALKRQIVESLYTIKTNREGLCEVGLGTLLGIHVDQKKRMVMKGEFQFSTHPFLIPESQYEAYEAFLKEINIFISSFVPDFQLVIEKLGTGSNKGIPFVSISINRKIGGSSLPLSQESAGIRKLISLTCALIYVYGNPNGWLVIDEFDSGVFEELLGQIVFVIHKNGKGQLLFTAHNLRPLERISSDSILFTTNNPDNRYISFKNLSKTSNLRDCYFRALKLGGQSEELSSQVGDDEIDLALFDGYEALKRTEELR